MKEISEIDDTTTAEIIQSAPDDAVAAALMEQTLIELATLPPIEYDRVREQTAKNLGIRLSTLDDEVKKRQIKTEPRGKSGGGTILLSDPEPWPESVDGPKLAEELRQLIERYAILPAGVAVAIVLWTLHTFLLDAADVSPILALTSPEKRCGKTVVLELLQATTYRPLPASNITAAALFRTIDWYKPTLLIDEADTFLEKNEEMRGVINSGHRPATAVIIRTTGDDHEPKTFSTWCPKAIAKIGPLPSTIEDRAINIRMRRKSPHEKAERLRFSRLRQETDELRQKAARWALDNLEALKSTTDPAMPSLNDRAADCWRPLISIADRIGGDWPDSARQAAIAISAKTEESSTRMQLLADVRDIFERENADKLLGETIVEELAKLDERPWPEWKNGKPITKSQLSRQLKNFDIVSKTVRMGLKTGKGYELSQFYDAFACYLDSQNVTASQPKSDVDFSSISKRHTNGDVTFSDTSQLAPVLNCDVVTLSPSESQEEDTI